MLHSCLSCFLVFVLRSRCRVYYICVISLFAFLNLLQGPKMTDLFIVDFILVSFCFVDFWWVHYHLVKFTHLSSIGHVLIVSFCWWLWLAVQALHLTNAHILLVFRKQHVCKINRFAWFFFNDVLLLKLVINDWSNADGLNLHTVDILGLFDFSQVLLLAKHFWHAFNSTAGSFAFWTITSPSSWLVVTYWFTVMAASIVQFVWDRLVWVGLTHCVKGVCSSVATCLHLVTHSTFLDVLIVGWCLHDKSLCALTPIESLALCTGSATHILAVHSGCVIVRPIIVRLALEHLSIGLTALFILIVVSIVVSILEKGKIPKLLVFTRRGWRYCLKVLLRLVVAVTTGHLLL